MKIKNQFFKTKGKDVWIFAFFIVQFFCFTLWGESIQIHVEHALTTKQKRIGLMNRRSLDENQGMLFHYSKPRKVTFWSYHTLVDLSVAFLDEEHRIQEIKALYASPKNEKAHEVSSSFPVSYVLEMNLGWFEKNDVQVGDKVEWDLNTDFANIVKTKS